MTTTNANQKRKHRLRKKARRRNLDALYAKQNSLCHWCGSQTVIVGNLRSEDVVDVSNGHVVWRKGAELVRARVATIDHLNGLDDPDTVVMACEDCNRNRSKRPKSPPEPIRRVCPDCQGEKPRGRPRCNACYVAKAQAWLAGFGWQAVPLAGSDKSLYRDPVTGKDLKLAHACDLQGKRLKRAAEEEADAQA